LRSFTGLELDIRIDYRHAVPKKETGIWQPKTRDEKIPFSWYKPLPQVRKSRSQRKEAEDFSCWI